MFIRPHLRPLISNPFGSLAAPAFVQGPIQMAPNPTVPPNVPPIVLMHMQAQARAAQQPPVQQQHPQAQPGRVVQLHNVVDVQAREKNPGVAWKEPEIPVTRAALPNPIEEMPGGSVSGCIERMESKGDIDDPGAYCAAIADRVEPGWREEE